MKQLRDWLQRRREAARKRRYREGYDWAAGALLRGEETPASIDPYIDMARAFGDYGPFEEGCIDARERLVRDSAVKEDRSWE